MSAPKRHRRSATLLASAIALGNGGAASAQTSPEAQAEALFAEARALSAKGRYVEACPKFEQSQRLDPAIGTMLWLADCYENTGRVATAWRTFNDAAALAKTAGQSERERMARQAAAALEPRLPRLTIRVRGDAPGLRIRYDGADVERGSWGTPQPADLGRHSVEALAPGRIPWSSAVEITGPGAVQVDVPPLATQPTSPPPTDAAHLAEARPGLGTQRTLALVAGAAGVVAIGVGAGFGVDAKSTYDASADQCRDDVCTESGLDVRQRAYGKATLSTALFVVGGATLIGGVVLWITAPPRGAATTARTKAAGVLRAAGGGFAW